MKFWLWINRNLNVGVRALVPFSVTTNSVGYRRSTCHHSRNGIKISVSQDVSAKLKVPLFISYSKETSIHTSNLCGVWPQNGIKDSASIVK